MSFKKSDFPVIRADFQKAVEEFEKKHNLKVSMGNIKYEDNEFSSKVTFTSNDMFTDENIQKEFEKNAILFNLEPTDYKRQFVAKGKTYELIGFELSRPKYPIKVREISTGKETLFVEDVLKMLI